MFYLVGRVGDVPLDGKEYLDIVGAIPVTERDASICPQRTWLRDFLCIIPRYAQCEVDILEQVGIDIFQVDSVYRRVDIVQ